MGSPARAGGDQSLSEVGRSLSDVPLYKKRFTIETDVDVIQPSGSYSLSYTVGRLSAVTDEGGAEAVEIVSTASTGPTRYRLPSQFPDFTELVLPLLSIPDVVKFTVSIWIPEFRAVTKALIVVELLRDTLSNPLGLRKLYAGAFSALYKRREMERIKRDKQESRLQEATPGAKLRPVELMPELVRKVRTRVYL